MDIKKEKSKIVDIVELYNSDKNPFHQYLTTAPFAKYHKHPSEDHSLPVSSDRNLFYRTDEYGNSINEWNLFFNLKNIEKLNYNFKLIKEFGFKGPRGDKGVRGDVGDDGPKGEIGDRGDKGETGDVGGEAYLVWYINIKDDNTAAIFPRYFKNELNPKIRRVVFGDVDEFESNTLSPKHYKDNDDLDFTDPNKIHEASLFVQTKNPTTKDEAHSENAPGFLQFAYMFGTTPTNVENVALFKRTENNTFNIFFRGFEIDNKNTLYSPRIISYPGKLSSEDYKGNIDGFILPDYYTSFDESLYNRLVIGGEVNGVENNLEIYINKTNPLLFDNDPSAKLKEFSFDLPKSYYAPVKLLGDYVIFDSNEFATAKNKLKFGTRIDDDAYTPGYIEDTFSAEMKVYDKDVVLEDAKTEPGQKFDYKIAFAQNKGTEGTDKYIDVKFTKWNGLFQRFPFGTILAISYKEWEHSFIGGQGSYNWPKNGLPFETDLGAGYNGYTGWYIANGQKWRLGDKEYVLPRLNEFDYQLEDGKISINTAEFGNTPVLLGTPIINMQLNPDDTMTNSIKGNSANEKIKFDDNDINRREDSPVWIVYLEEPGYKWKIDGDDIAMLNDITLSYNATEAPITCSLLNNKTYKTNLPLDTTDSFNDLSDTTPVNKLSRLYIQEGEKYKLAPIGWYSTGNIVRYFDGLQFVQEGQFAPKRCIDLALTEITLYKSNWHWLLNTELLSQDNKSMLSLEARAALPNTDIRKLEKITGYAPNVNVFTGDEFGKIGALELFGDKFNKSIKLTDGWYRFREYIFKIENGTYAKSSAGANIIHKVDNIYPLGFEPEIGNPITLGDDMYVNFSEFTSFPLNLQSYIYNANSINACETFNGEISANKPAYFGFVELKESIKPTTYIKDGAKLMVNNFKRIFVYENQLTSKNIDSDLTNASIGKIIPLKMGERYLFSNVDFKASPYNRSAGTRRGFLGTRRPSLILKPYNKVFFTARNIEGYIQNDIGDFDTVSAGCPIPQLSAAYYVPRFETYPHVPINGTSGNLDRLGIQSGNPLLARMFHGFNAIDAKSMIEAGFDARGWNGTFLPDGVFNVIKNNIYWSETTKHREFTLGEQSLGFDDTNHRARWGNNHINPRYRFPSHDDGCWQITSNTFRFVRDNSEPLRVNFKTNLLLHKYRHARPNSGVIFNGLTVKLFDKDGNPAKSNFENLTMDTLPGMLGYESITIDNHKIMINTPKYWGKGKSYHETIHCPVNFSINFHPDEKEVYTMFIYVMNGRTYTRQVMVVNFQYQEGSDKWGVLYNNFETSVNNNDVMNFHNNAASNFKITNAPYIITSRNIP